MNNNHALYNPRIIAWIIAIALFMETLDSTILSTAIPQIARNLQVDPISLKLVLTSYLISLAVFIPVSGWLADKFGTKRIFSGAIVIFTLGSIFCGLSHSIMTLVLARIVQGLGGALMMPVGRIVLFRVFPKKHYIKATTFVTIPALVAPVLGPAVGGAIVNYFSWRWIFFVNVPIGILGFILANKYIANFINPKNPVLDKIGFILFSVGLAGFSFSFSAIGEQSWPVTVALILSGASLIFIFFYFLHARQIKHPLLNLSVFQTRTFNIALWGGSFCRLSLGAMPFLLPLCFQLSFHWSPLRSGLFTAPIAAGMLTMKFFVNRIIKAFNFKNVLLVNTVLLACTTWLFIFIASDTRPALLVSVTFLYGALVSLHFTTFNVLAYVDLPDRYLSAGTSIGSVIQQLSMSFGVAIAALLLRLFLFAEQTVNYFSIEVAVFHKSFICLGALILLSLYIFSALKPDDGAEAIK